MPSPDDPAVSGAVSEAPSEAGRPFRHLVLATHNDGKLREFRTLFAPFDVTLTSAGELELPVPDETGATFEENAALKARAAGEALAGRGGGEWTLADDSGLCVAALGGRPGVHTADWAETEGGRDFDHAMRRVERELGRVERELGRADRRAFFCAVLCLRAHDGTQRLFRGEVHGDLVWPPRGDLGFGYDPVFRPDGHARTFGEMREDEKHSWSPARTGLSHRARAFGELARAVLA